MILPIGHENQSVRRIPWVTITIMALCLIVHIVVTSQMGKVEKSLGHTAQAYFEYYLTHPYLQMDPELEKMFLRTPGQRALADQYAKKYGGVEPSGSMLDMEQEELDHLAKKLKHEIQGIPLIKYGYVPARRSFLTMITSMFLHADWLHLIFNMLFLYLSAPFIEDVWGKPIFIVFYLFVGALAALMHATHFPKSITPLVGASGAIAGVMGAFLVRYWNTRIRFAYFFSLFIRGTFKAPAWMMIPLWLGEQLLAAKMADNASSLVGNDGGVAYWVHVWGFLFGFLIAVIISFLGIEKKFIAPKIEKKTSFVNESFSLHEQAVSLQSEGKKEESFALLLEGAKKDPNYTDIVESLWNLSLDLNRQQEAAYYVHRMMEQHIKRNNLEHALLYHDQLKHHEQEITLSPASLILLLEQMVNQNQLESALEFSRPLYQHINAQTPPGILMSFCNAVSRIDLGLNRTDAQHIIKTALNHPDIPEPSKEMLRERLMAGSKPGQGKSAADLTLSFDNQYNTPPPLPEIMPVIMPGVKPSVMQGVMPGVMQGTGPGILQPPPIPVDPLERQIEEAIVIIPKKIVTPTPAQPLGVKEGRIALEVENVGQRALPLEKIKGIAVVKIAEPGKGVYILIDLFLDDPRQPAKAGSSVINIRSLRVSSNNFNPQSFIPNTKNLSEAYKIFTTGLLKMSGAHPFPDSDAVKLKKVVTYPSIQSYETALFS